MVQREQEIETRVTVAAVLKLGFGPTILRVSKWTIESY